MEQPSVAIVTGVSSGLGRCFALNRAAREPAAHTDMARRLYEDEEIPVARRARFHAALVDDGDDMLRYSLEMFRFIATGAPTTSADATWDFTQPVATASMN